MPTSSAEPQDLPDAFGQAPDMMDILMDISSWLRATEHFVQKAERDKVAAATRRRASPSQGRTIAPGQRGPNAPAGSQDEAYKLDTVHTTTTDLPVREKIMRCWWQVLILEITTTDADSDSEEESRKHGSKRGH